jgi:hypothetical protein
MGFLETVEQRSCRTRAPPWNCLPNCDWRRATLASPWTWPTDLPHGSSASHSASTKIMGVWRRTSSPRSSHFSVTIKLKCQSISQCRGVRAASHSSTSQNIPMSRADCARLPHGTDVKSQPPCRRPVPVGHRAAARSPLLSLTRVSRVAGATVTAAVTCPGRGSGALLYEAISARRLGHGLAVAVALALGLDRWRPLGVLHRRYPGQRCT